jgi:hypothetical protein
MFVMFRAALAALEMANRSQKSRTLDMFCRSRHIQIMDSRVGLPPGHHINKAHQER